MIKICVIGLGYVGLPICIRLSNFFNVIGFDIKKNRIKQLKNNKDYNFEYTAKELKNKKLFFSNKIEQIKNCNIYIICVPTPINSSKSPDLSFIKNSFNMLSKIIKKNDLIILESTVYPGVTRHFISKLENHTKLVNNKDFFTCYSPERINPGDKKNQLSKINKILAYEGNNLNIKKKLLKVYSKICKRIILTKKIEEAETAKVIENIQRDLNIAFFNEILLICEKLKLNFNEVVKLAATKWNFVKFAPGLVGGHCLPVDPYYLSFIANKKRYMPQITLAGRKVNEYMKIYVLRTIEKIIKKKNVKICILGLTYKYGVSDIRNSLNLEIYKILKKKLKSVKAYDPFYKSKSMNDKKNIKNSDYYIFLTQGKVFKNIFQVTPKDKVIDPFYYYTN